MSLGRIYAIAAACTIVLAGIVWARLAADPLRRSNTAIEASLLLATPVGTPRDSVRARAKREGWERSDLFSFEPGLDFDGPEPPDSLRPVNSFEVGGYQGLPWYVTVVAVFKFDTTSHLQGVTVHKMYDSF